MPVADSLIGVSEAIRRLEQDIQCATGSDAKVLITGESGVGKEVAAQLIHKGSARRNRPFLTLNCAGVPDSLLESELFGHMRGSFTDAYRDKPGLLEAADGGTVLLDEVGEMSPRMQGLLLRFLENGEMQRIGATRSETRIDVRIIAATNRNLFEGIATGAFRGDLYYRLNVIRIEIPPLRARPEDIGPLVTHFVTHFAAMYHIAPPPLGPHTLSTLQSYPWPGNVRELRNYAERLVVRCVAGLPRDEPPPGEQAHAAPAESLAHPQISRADRLYERMVTGGESFWSAVYPGFINRDLTREDLRAIVSRGLQHTRGSYKLLLQLFNMKPEDYKRLLTFLRKHDCHMPFHTFRTAVPADELRSRPADTRRTA